MKFLIEYCSKFKSPYWGGYVTLDRTELKSNAGKTICYENSNIYEGLDYSTFKDLLREVLDYPTDEMTADDVQREFSAPELGPVKEAEVNEILGYYNGRRDIALKILAAVEDNIKKAQSTALESNACDIELKYDIPASANQFSVYPSDDPCYRKEEQIFSFIRVVMSELDKAPEEE